MSDNKKEASLQSNYSVTHVYSCHTPWRGLSKVFFLTTKEGEANKYHIKKERDGIIKAENVDDFINSHKGFSLDKPVPIPNTHNLYVDNKGELVFATHATKNIESRQHTGVYIPQATRSPTN